VGAAFGVVGGPPGAVVGGILIFLLIFALLTFAGLRFMLNNQNDKALSNYQNVISAPQEQAHITIYLP
ncbi:hypothetical protein J842_4018, partial [Acinetobacter baumannii 25935_9]